MNATTTSRATEREREDVTQEGRGLNVLVLTDSFLPHAGGSRVYYHTVYDSLVRQYADRVTILTKKVQGWEEFDSAANTERLQIVRRSRPLENWKWYQAPKLIPCFSNALAMLQTGRFDLIHVGDLFPQGVAAMWLKKMTGVPYVAYCHGEEVTQIDGRRYQPRVRDAIYQSADAVIAASEFARQNLLRIGIPEEKVVKITPGVNSEQFALREKDPELVRRLGLENKTILLTVGRLVPRKGHSIVLQALSRIRNVVPPFQYVIAGEGPERSAIESLVQQLGLSDVVSFLGKVPNDELPHIYGLCDVFVLCNREVKGDVEGFGMVFLEANAAGKPVVGGRTGGASEAVVDNVTGLLVDPENVDEVAGALKRLLEDGELRRSFGEAGAIRARKDFSWESRAARLREVSWSVVNRTRNVDGRARG